MIALLKDNLPAELSVLVLPVQAVGKSNEHLVSGDAQPLGRDLQHLLSRSGRAWPRRFARDCPGDSDGGNASVLTTVAREPGVRFGMLAVVTHRRCFGCRTVRTDAVESRTGIHAGDIETSLMLSFCHRSRAHGPSEEFRLDGDRRWKRIQPLARPAATPSAGSDKIGTQTARSAMPERALRRRGRKPPNTSRRLNRAVVRHDDFFLNRLCAPRRSDSLIFLARHAPTLDRQCARAPCVMMARQWCRRLVDGEGMVTRAR